MGVTLFLLTHLSTITMKNLCSKIKKITLLQLSGTLLMSLSFVACHSPNTSQEGKVIKPSIKSERVYINTDEDYISPFTPIQKVSQGAEYDTARVILMHEPGNEILMGTMHPKAALFEGYFSRDEAKIEHALYRKSLQEKGIKVYTIRDILLKGTLDDDGHMVAGKDLEKLRELASSSLDMELVGFSMDESAKQLDYRNSIVSEMTPYDLLDVVMNQPKIILKREESNTGYAADYLLNPIMNLYFSRDQMITTNKGVVLGRFHSEQRYAEAQMIDICLEKMGIEPIYRVTDEDSYLEGGDFIPFGDCAFIATGLRTNRNAVNNLIESDVFGCNMLIVVKDTWQHQEQMHLDTYFNVIDKDLVVLEESRYYAQYGDNKHISCDIYIKDSQGNFKIQETDVDFRKQLEKKMKIQVIPVPTEDQLRYGINFLTIYGRYIMAVENSMSPKYKDALIKAGVTIEEIDYSALTKGYGATHCTTQVLSRN